MDFGTFSVEKVFPGRSRRGQETTNSTPVVVSSIQATTEDANVTTRSQKEISVEDARKILKEADRLRAVARVASRAVEQIAPKSPNATRHDIMVGYTSLSEPEIRSAIIDVLTDLAKRHEEEAALLESQVMVVRSDVQ